MTTQHGSVILSMFLLIHYVLFIQELKCSLISLVELMKTRCCFITMTNDLCVIYDHISSTSIRVGEERNGFFIYKSSQLSSLKVCHAKTIVSNKLWHYQAGCPS